MMSCKRLVAKSAGTAEDEPERQFEVIDSFGSALSIISEHEIIIDDLDQCNPRPDCILTIKSEDEMCTAFQETDQAPSPVKKEKPEPPVRNSTLSPTKPEFSKEKDIPDVSMKVYDFVMSKDKTIQKNTICLAEHAEIRHKIYWIGGLILASLLVLVIIVIVLCTVKTSSPNLNT